MDQDILSTLDPRELGRRLQDARKQRGLTQEEAAAHLGVARTTLTAVEKGERRVRPLEFVRLTELYGRTVADLLRHSRTPDTFTVQLRAQVRGKDDLEAESQNTARTFHDLSADYTELEALRKAPLTRRYPSLYQWGGVSAEEAGQDAADEERNRLGLGDGPVLHLREMLESDVGMRIFYIPMPSRIAAMFGYTEDLGGCIAVNAHHPEERRRMSIGHDYAHFLENRYQAEVLMVGRYRRTPAHEQFAEAFARAFLMPSTGLRRRFNDLRTRRGGTVTPADLVAFAHLYFVSVEAMARRLEELRLLPAGTWERLDRMGFRVRDAQAELGLGEHPFYGGIFPVRYVTLALEAYRAGQLTEGQAADFLRTDRMTVREIVTAVTGDTDDSQAELFAQDLLSPDRADIA